MYIERYIYSVFMFSEFFVSPTGFLDVTLLTYHGSSTTTQSTKNSCHVSLFSPDAILYSDKMRTRGEEDGGGDLDYTSMTDFKPVMAGMK